MKSLYLKLIELLKEIPEIKYIDLNFGQIGEEKPPLIYPAVLVDMGIRSTETYQEVFQEINAEFTITLITLSRETHSLHEAERISHALDYLDLCDKINRKLQGYEDGTFISFDKKSHLITNPRKGITTTALRYETGWREDFATP